MAHDYENIEYKVADCKQVVILQLVGWSKTQRIYNVKESFFETLPRASHCSGIFEIRIKFPNYVKFGEFLD
jgi:hypothetical protein